MESYIFDNYSRKELRYALKQTAPEIFDDVLRFLEADLRTMGSGYEKEMMWRYIRRYELQPTHLNRLEGVALKYLERPMSREFKYMCQTMSRIATSSFWQVVQARLKSDNSIVALNAYCLLPYSKGIYTGEQQRLQLRRLTINVRWGRNRWYRERKAVTVEDVLKVVTKRSNWKDGQLPKRIADSAYIASRYYDEEFTNIDWAQCIPKILIPRLGSLLMKCQIDDWPHEPAVYIAYAMQEIGDPLAVPILIDFLEQKVDYKFESVKKSTIHTAFFRALQHIGTPEALETVASRMGPYLAWGQVQL